MELLQAILLIPHDALFRLVAKITYSHPISAFRARLTWSLVLWVLIVGAVLYFHSVIG